MLPRTPAYITTDRLYFEAPYDVGLRSERLPLPGLNQVLVRTLASAVSAGTEMLFYRGQAPADMPLDSALASLPGACTYPLRYGYACVGVVESIGPGVDRVWLGRRVFAFEPHATAFVAPVTTLIPVPKDLATDAAALLPNAETATNLVLDGAPLLGERAVVFGAGVVGLLTTALLARFPLERLVVVDPDPARREHALRLGAHSVYPNVTDPEAPGNAPLRDFDLLFELSGNPAALNDAIRAAGFGARVVIGSWYGAKQATIDLGGHFHRSRIQLIGSQVSTLAPALTGRWDKPRRIAQAWNVLQSLDVLKIITHRLPFAQASDAYRMIDQQPGDVLQLLFTYGEAPRESVG